MLRRRIKSTHVSTKDSASGRSTVLPSRVPPGHGPGQLAFLALLAARLASACLNLIHDCDEVYNYWEPLHHLLYAKGLQTWEYSAEFALRSYWYLDLHAAVVLPLLNWAGTEKGKLVVFFWLRIVFALASFASEAYLIRSIERRVSPALARISLSLLTASSACFIASTAFLPSTFTGLALTIAVAAALERRVSLTVAVSVAGVVWGWCVAGIAFLPLALLVLLSCPLARSLPALALALLATLAPLALADRAAYGRWTVSLLNFVRYNVVGGGDSALYGIEGPAFYLRNAAVNFQAGLALVMAAPLALPLAGLPKKARVSLGALVLGPAFLWLAAISALPHKEERFLFVMCVAAGTTVLALGRGSRAALRMLGWEAHSARRGSRALTLGVLALFALGSISRLAALYTGYRAPPLVFAALPSLQGSGHEVPVCLGAEWYRFPSSFWLPGPRYRLQFVKSGFTGLLPRPFSAEELNNLNREEPENAWATSDGCAYLVTQRWQDPGAEQGWAYLDKPERYEERCTFTSFGNWLIPGRLMLGRYPFIEPSRCREMGEAQLKQLLEAGITTFICLQEELPPQAELTVGGHNGFQAYKPIAGLLAASLAPPPSQEQFNGLRTPDLDKFLPPRRKAVADPEAAAARISRDLTFLHHPIVDLGLPEPDILEGVLSDLRAQLEEGRGVYLHCWGGRGRAGTVGAAFLRRAYGLGADEALDRVQRAFSTRRDNIARSPETDEQQAFIRALAACQGS
ncbi:hypothetical protein APUTEX25_003231 [Auxenochlorella protothecoides]|uniref:Mannosyltransferase n=1 Tax=Auxenochlorella protothecoides TaxID=3075 RepID=A0A3M7KTL9_AUXPR|nr:hypothetical protein APUTEX25_003231 [Auxenochlorella protothecoides]|eukprot:RMZ53697.1 hypothetical protein APUTEX25_003231 [Auxenochlorella protothecoides]